MYTLNVDTVIDWNPVLSKQSVRFIRMFGLPLNRFKTRLRLQCRLTLKPGQICFITGPAGSGKTLLLNALYEYIDPADRICPADLPLQSETAVIDSIPSEPDGTLNGWKILTQFGLGDDFTMLNRPSSLSAGQQSQYQLACALMSGRQWIFADDFTASLDRVSACAAAYHLRKLVRQMNLICVLASCHEDILGDLRPDVLVIQSANRTSRVLDIDTPSCSGSLMITGS